METKSRNLSSRYIMPLKYNTMKKIIVLILTLQSIMGYSQCWFKDLLKVMDNDATPTELKALINSSIEYEDVYKILYTAEKHNAKLSKQAIVNFKKLDAKVQEQVLHFSDIGDTPTLKKFLNEANDEFINYLNKNSEFAEGFVGHKTALGQQDYELLGELANEVTIPEIRTKIDYWLNRSSKISNFNEVTKLGKQLGVNIVNSIKGKTKIFNLLTNKLNIPENILKEYKVFEEVAIKVPVTPKTPGGFMKADVMLIKYDDLGEIEDIIVIENKLSSGTGFTEAQKLKFTEVKNAPSNSTIDFELKFDRNDIGLEANNTLQVKKDRVIKINDGGTDNISNITNNDINLISSININ